VVISIYFVVWRDQILQDDQKSNKYRLRIVKSKSRVEHLSIHHRSEYGEVEKQVGLHKQIQNEYSIESASTKNTLPDSKLCS
jgi:hypothetical protein